MVYVDERLDVIEDVECGQVGHDECVDDWLEEVEDLDVVHLENIDVGETGAVTERN